MDDKNLFATLFLVILFLVITIGITREILVHFGVIGRKVGSATNPNSKTVPSSATKTGNSVVHRYLDLYRAARLLVSIGNVVKIIGVVLGIGILVLCLSIGLAGPTETSPFGPQSAQSASLTIRALVVGSVLGTFVGGIVFLLGILISAQGQILLAQADAAIHTSPFMTEEEKAMAMSLPYQRAAEQIVGREQRERVSQLDSSGDA